MKPALSQLRTEIRHFNLVSLLNLVFAPLATTFGVQYMVTSVLYSSSKSALGEV